jgi:hypothetical protein
MYKEENLRFLKQDQWKNVQKDQEEVSVIEIVEEEASAVVIEAEDSAAEEEDINYFLIPTWG